MKAILSIIFVCISAVTTAQIGTAAIGKSIIGRSDFSPAVIAQAITTVCALPNSCGDSTGCPIYIFTGEGDWRIPGNWAGGNMPPTELPNCYQIIINPVSNKSVMVNPQTFYTGSKLHVMPGKTLIVPGNVFVQ
ncbi:hypothetical protein [Phnomibacter sp. MR]|uniref:hypothetical protein n=1 Tax=Phnomibacter sp. MR TaxID=3042318 RepID=UPI003A812A01